MSRLIGYVREKQDVAPMEVQLEELLAAGCTQIFEDEGEPVDTDGLHGCLDELQPGDTLVITSLGVVASTLPELEQVLSNVRARSAGLTICHWHPAPPLSPGDLCEIVRKLIEFHSEARRVKIKAGVAAARAEGRVGGKRHRLKPEQVRALREAMAVPGADAVEVGKRFGLARATVYRYLKQGAGRKA